MYQVNLSRSPRGGQAMKKIEHGDKGGRGKSLELRRMILEDWWSRQYLGTVEIDKPRTEDTVS